MLRRKRRKVGTVLLGAGLYAVVGITAAGVRPVDTTAETWASEACPADLLEHSPGGDAELTILQGNVWMLPTRLLVVPYAFSTDREERLERLIDTVVRCRPLVITLQEVFDRSVLTALAESLPEYQLVTSDRTGFMGHFNVSGLATLTRVPVERQRFHAFGALPEGASMVERLSGKGFLVTEIEAPGFRGNLINLHLYAAHDSADAPMTRVQLREVLAFVEREERLGRPSLLVGDFNLSRREMERLLPASWALSRHGPTYDPIGNPYTAQGANGGLPWRGRKNSLRDAVRAIDFLVAPAGAGVRVRSGVLDQLPLSDHYFLQHSVAATDR